MLMPVVGSTVPFANMWNAKAETPRKTYRWHRWTIQHIIKRYKSMDGSRKSSMTRR